MPRGSAWPGAERRVTPSCLNGQVCPGGQPGKRRSRRYHAGASGLAVAAIAETPQAKGEGMKNMSPTVSLAEISQMRGAQPDTALMAYESLAVRRILLAVRLAVFALVFALMCTGVMAQTDATDIATAAETAFGVVAPIVITIASFFVIVRIAKRVVK